MEQNILNNIEKIYRDQLVTVVIVTALVAAVIVVAVCILKFKLIASNSARIIVVISIIVGAVLLLLLQIDSFYPILKDYEESSYVVLEDAEVIITESYSLNGGIDYINSVTAIANGIEYEFKMRADYALSAGEKHRGNIAYLKHSHYLIWYDFD